MKDKDFRPVQLSEMYAGSSGPSDRLKSEKDPSSAGQDNAQTTAVPYFLLLSSKYLPAGITREASD